METQIKPEMLYSIVSAEVLCMYQHLDVTTDTLHVPSEPCQVLMDTSGEKPYIVCLYLGSGAADTVCINHE